MEGDAHARFRVWYSAKVFSQVWTPFMYTCTVMGPLCLPGKCPFLTPRPRAFSKLHLSPSPFLTIQSPLFLYILNATVPFPGTHTQKQNRQKKDSFSMPCVFTVYSFFFLIANSYSIAPTWVVNLNFISLILQIRI